MLHPYTLTPLSLESQSAEPLPERKYGASREVEVGGPGRKTGKLRDLGRLSLWRGKERRGVEVRGESSAEADIMLLQSPELEYKYRGGGERGCCIPRANHCTANNGVELRVR